MAGAPMVMKSRYTANSFMAAETAGDPTARTVAPNTLMGRLASGAIGSLTVSQVLTILGLTLEDIQQIVAVTALIRAANLADLEDPAEALANLGGMPLPTGGALRQAWIKNSGEDGDFRWGGPYPPYVDYTAGETRLSTMTGRVICVVNEDAVPAPDLPGDPHPGNPKPGDVLLPVEVGA